MDNDIDREIMKIALCGYYGANNFGDSLMQSQLSRLLSQNGKSKVTAYSDKATDDVCNGLVDRAYLKSDVIVVGGGGIVTPNLWLFRNGGLQKLIDSRLPVVFLNVNTTQELLPGNDCTFVNQLKELNSRWWVREITSVHQLTCHGIKSQWIPDITFRPGMVPDHISVPGGKVCNVFLNGYGFEHLFSDKNLTRFFRANAAARILAHHLDWLADFGWKINFVPAQTAQQMDDRVIGGVIHSMMRNRGAATWRVDAPDWPEIINVIAASDLLISMRFHSTTIATAIGVPFVDLTHHAKNRNFLKELGLEAVSVELDTFIHDDLINATQIARTLFDGNSDPIHAFRAEAHARWKQFDKDWADYMKGLENKT